MKYFFDTEFYEDGERIHPISLGMVREDRKELYFEYQFDESIVSDWVRDHVVCHLEWKPEHRITRPDACEMLLDFVGDDPKPEFWAYFADYDWILLCQTFGTMMDLPEHFPKFCMDIQQYWYTLGKPHKSRVRPAKPANAHNALADARWNLDYYKNLKSWWETKI